ncbi:unnamed protein product [Effrenium voratum]|nr:unnamed protein product [Effrenium voratum]CAJ1417912.1 unnamed protein product [Effrenium voratum]
MGGSQEELGEEEVLRVFAAAEPGIQALAESPGEFMKNCPPAGPENSAAVLPSWAETLLEQQPGLKETRFRLVPAKLREEDFWDRYFAAVFHIIQLELQESAG